MFTRRFIAGIAALYGVVTVTAVRAAPMSADEMIRRTFHAEKNVNFIGTQVSLVSIKGQERKSRLTIMHKVPNLMRVEFDLPPETRGQIIVADGQFRWRYFPQKKEVIKTPQEMGGRKRCWGDHRTRLAEMNFHASLLGEEKIAGHPAFTVQVEPNVPGPPVRKLWIDQETFLRLKSQTIDRLGNVVESTEFEKINFNPSFEVNTFNFTPPQGVRVIEPPPRKPAEVLKSLSELKAKAPFPVKTPDFLPKGFAWDSGSLQQHYGRVAVVWIRYTDGINTLSLFQRKMNRDLPDSAPRPAPRGAVMWAQDGISFFLVGNLPADILMKIANSVQ